MNGFQQLLVGDDESIELDEDVRDIYGRLPSLDLAEQCPFLYVNFASSLDGKISFGGARPGAQFISKGTYHDRWLMAALRARADAVMVGAGTVWADPEHQWTSGYICPEAEPMLSRLREAENRSGTPLSVVLSHDGRLPASAKVLTEDSRQQCLVITTTEGSRRVGVRSGLLQVVTLGEGSLDLVACLQYLDRVWGCRRILCEGGPGLYASLLRAGIRHDLYLTTCPLLVGGKGEDSSISLVQGSAFTVESAPEFNLCSVRAGSGQLFLRYASRFTERPSGDTADRS